MKATSKADERYTAYIRVVDACSGEFSFLNVHKAMKHYAQAYSITPSGIQSIARGIVADNGDMIELAIHRWRTASDNFSRADHDASLKWRAQHDPVYIKEHSKMSTSLIQFTILYPWKHPKNGTGVIVNLKLRADGETNLRQAGSLSMTDAARAMLQQQLCPSARSGQCPMEVIDTESGW